VSEEIVKVKPLWYLGDESPEMEVDVKTVWIVAETGDHYPCFNVVSIHSNKEDALNNATCSAAFPLHRGFYWKAQEVVLRRKKVKEVE